MKKKIIVLFLLTGLFSGCKPAAPPTLSTATKPPISSATPAQTIEPSLASIPATLPAGGLTLERFAQLGGRINGITVVGDMAYVGMGPRVAGIDISNHGQPQLILQSEPLPGMVTRLLQISSGPTPLLLVNAGKFLMLIDISNPDELKPLRQLELEGAVSALAWDDRAGVAFAGGSIYHYPTSAGYTGFISAIGISPDKELVLINSVTMPERPLSLALGEGSLFAGAGGYQGGLYHLQVKTPGGLSTPHLVIPSTPESPLQPLHMQVIGRTLYLSYRAMEAYDITDPEKPVQIWKKGSGNGDVIDSFTLAGDQIYFFGWTILSEYVRGALTLAEPITGAPVGVGASVTAMHNGDFLVAYNILEIHADASPPDLQLVGSYQPPVTNAIGAVINEKAVFVLDNQVGDQPSQAVLRVLSLPDLSPLGRMTTEIPNQNDWAGRFITLENDRLYLAALDNVWVYDVSRIQPILLGNVAVVDGQIHAISAIQLGEKRLLVIAQEGSDQSISLRIHDLTDLQKPGELGSPLPLDQGIVLQMVWNGPALYVLLDTSYHSHNDLLYVIHFEQNALTLKDSLKLAEYTENMAGDGKQILLADFGKQARRPSLSTVELEPLKILAQMSVPEAGMGVAIRGDKAFVVVGYDYGAAQLLMFDVLDPANPRQVEAMDIPVSDINHVSILVTGLYVVLANGQGGVEVFSSGN